MLLYVYHLLANDKSYMHTHTHIYESRLFRSLLSNFLLPASRMDGGAFM